MGFILYYNLITPYFVRQHYKAVQLKMTVSPTTGFPEKASARIPFSTKDVFSLQKNQSRGGKKQLPCFKLLGFNKMVVGDRVWGLERQRKQKTKGKEGRCQAHTEEPPFIQ